MCQSWGLGFTPRQERAHLQALADYNIEVFGLRGEGADPVDTATVLADGQRIQGLNGLRDYLAGQRQEEFVRQFCKKLLGYALGREVLLSDQPLVDKMMADLKRDNFRFHTAVRAVVTSTQFRQVRGQHQVAP